VKLNERFFEDFGEVPIVGGCEFRRESRGIIVESKSNRNDGKLRGFKTDLVHLVGFRDDIVQRSMVGEGGRCLNQKTLEWIGMES
jgi:hypothetical protein